MAQPINTQFYRGTPLQYLRELINPSNYLRTDNEIQGIRLSIEDNTKYLSPQLLKTDDDFKRDVCQSDNEIHVLHRQQSEE